MNRFCFHLPLILLFASSVSAELTKKNMVGCQPIKLSLQDFSEDSVVTVEKKFETCVGKFNDEDKYIESMELEGEFELYPWVCDLESYFKEGNTHVTLSCRTTRSIPVGVKRCVPKGCKEEEEIKWNPEAKTGISCYKGKFVGRGELSLGARVKGPNGGYRMGGKTFFIECL